jgi:hypothetical protein
MYGFVYVLKNSSMPNLYKVGHTLKSPQQRAKELSSQTNMPESFEVVFYGEISNPNRLENELHEIYAENRINASREFFKLTDDEVFWLCHYIKEICDNVSHCEHYYVLENNVIHGGNHG